MMESGISKIVTQKNMFRLSIYKTIIEHPPTSDRFLPLVGGQVYYVRLFCIWNSQ